MSPLEALGVAIQRVAIAEVFKRNKLKHTILLSTFTDNPLLNEDVLESDDES